MNKKSNAIYIAGGSGTVVSSASAYGLISRIFNGYRDKIDTFYAAVGGFRGAIYEDITDVFKYAREDGHQNIATKLNKLKFYTTPVFGTSRINPDERDCERLMDVFAKHNINFVFINGGNDSMKSALFLNQYARNKGYDLYIIGIPKTIDNDLLVTHRSLGYASFAKQVAIALMSLESDVNAFSIPHNATRGGPIKETAVAQVVVFMGRNEGWGAAATVIGKLDESYGPHVILTKEGDFSIDAFLDRCQNAWDRYERLIVASSEGAHDRKDYLANYLEVNIGHQDLRFKQHNDPHQNKDVSDNRLGLFLKILLENRLNIPSEVYKDLKCRAEGVSYLNRNHLEVMSLIDFRDAIAVGEKAADLAFGRSTPIQGVMVILTQNVGETDYTRLENVADITKGSKGMTKSIRILDTPAVPILTNDGMMIDGDLYMRYIGEFIDLNGPNRSELLRGEGFRLPLRRLDWSLEARLLQPYQKIEA